MGRGAQRQGAQRYASLNQGRRESADWSESFSRADRLLNHLAPIVVGQLAANLALPQSPWLVRQGAARLVRQAVSPLFPQHPFPFPRQPPGVPTSQPPGVPTPQPPGVPVPQPPGIPTGQLPGVLTPQLPGFPGTGGQSPTGWGIPIGFTGGSEGLETPLGIKLDFSFFVNLLGFGTTKIEAQKEAIQEYFSPLFRAGGFGRALRFDSPGVRRVQRERQDLWSLRDALLNSISSVKGEGLRERIVNQFLANAGHKNLTAQQAVTLWNSQKGASGGSHISSQGGGFV